MLTMAEHTIVFHLLKVSKRMQKALGLKTQSFELSSTQASALIVVATHKAINQVNIALKLNLRPASVVSLIDELESMNMLTRHAGKEDRRKYHIYITPKGREEVKKIRQRTLLIDDYIKSKLTNKEIENFISALDKLSDDDELNIEKLNIKSKEVKNELPSTKQHMEA